MPVIRSLAIAMVLLAFVCVPGLAREEYQDFTNAPADWTSRTFSGGGYTEVAEWSAAGLAGGAPGEAHVKFHRLHNATDSLNDCIAWYADTDLAGTLDVAALRVLTASGKFIINDAITSPDLGAGAWIGWFRPGGACRMGIMFNDYGANVGWHARIVDNGGNIVADQLMGSVAKGVKYTFQIEFDNLEGIYNKGRLMVRITPEGGVTEEVALHLAAPFTMYEFSAFGIVRPNPTLDESRNNIFMDISADDLRYTSNKIPFPQPSRLEYQSFGANPSDWTARAMTEDPFTEITGWSNTNLTGFAPGEGHAKFYRLQSPTDSLNDCISWYADTDLGGPLNVENNVLIANGYFKINDSTLNCDLGTGAWIGWFRPGGASRLGIFINNNHAESAPGWYAGIVDNGGNVVAQQYIGSLAMGVKYNFDIEFHNLDGINGKGRLVAKMTPEGGTTEVSIIHLSNYLSSYEYTAFGLVRPEPGPYAPYNSHMLDIYMDNLFYSSNIAGAPPVVALDAAKKLADDSTVSVTGVVTAVSYEGFFYIESPNRNSGIRVSRNGYTATLNKTATVSGKLATLDTGERYIVADPPSEADGPSVAPVAMTNKALGGGKLGDPDTGKGQYGVDGGDGLNNIGLLVRTTGKVTVIDESSFTITDGSGVSVTVVCPWGSAPENGSYVAVTGISSCLKDASNKIQRKIIVTPSGSIDTVNP